MYIAWVLSLVVIFLLGYHAAKLAKRVEKIESTIKSKVDKPVEEPSSTLIDLDDPIKEAQYEQEKLMAKLNPDEK